MATATITREQERADAHNASVNLDLARAGYCGMTHLYSGRVCVRKAHHLGSCEFRSPEEAAEVLGVDLVASGTG